MSLNNKPNWWLRGSVLGLVALGFALRLYALGRESLWYDELLQLDIAQGPLNLLVSRLRGHSAVPLDYLISHGWMMLGRSDTWVRLPAAFIGTLSLPLFYRLGRNLLGRPAGLMALALLAFSPFHVRYSQEVRPYALLVLGVILAVWSFWRLWQTGQWRYALPLQIGVLLFALSHAFGLVMLVPLSVFLAVMLAVRRQWTRTFQTVIMLVITMLLPAAVFTSMGWSDVLFFSSREFGRALVSAEALPAGAPLAETTTPAAQPRALSLDGPFLVNDIAKPLVGLESGWALRFLGALAVFGLIYLLFGNQFQIGLLLLLWILLPPILIVLFLNFRETFFAPRYIITILPAFLLLIAAGLAALPRGLARWRLQYPGLGIALAMGTLILALFSGSLDQLYRYPDKENWHLVADFLVSNADPADAVIALNAEPTLNWYYPAAQAAPNFYQDLETVQAAVSQAKRSWVILSIFSSGEDGRIKAWLSEQQAIRFALDPLIHVYYMGYGVMPDQLLSEVQQFALPVDHALYASLARENRRRPEVARHYYRLAIDHAPDEQSRAVYRAALDALVKRGAP